MGFKFLDSLALSVGASPVLGIMPVVGTGLAAYGVYKLVKGMIFDDKKTETPKNDYVAYRRDDYDDSVLVDQMPVVDDVKEENKTTVGEIAKCVGWIFGGMVIKDTCHIVKSWCYRHLLGMFTNSTDNLYSLWASINRSMGDIQTLASCADDGKRIGMLKSVDFMSGNLLRDGFYTWRRIG